ncbi:MAG: hypothetical protein JWO66_1857 [Candidatus Eremiobacteraeota bacterium]|jgi:hypothetical protein|nr:hypothetical protein [Candidatus Eremiobacteraeota bacterium]
MKDRSFAELMIGAIACISVLGVCAVLKETELDEQRKRRAAAKWALPRKRKRRRSPEDDCRHCTGTGTCDECAPAACRVCQGNGLQPRDAAVVSRLAALWNPTA